MSPTPDAVAPPPRHPRFPLVDGLRGLAVLLVVLVHVEGATTGVAGTVPGRLLAHGNLGVTVFFLISGFLLFRPFVAARAGGPPPPSVRSYARRRALRILPAYWLALAVLGLVPGVPGLGGARLWPMVTLTQTLPVLRGPGCSELLARCSLAQTWSLGAELTFYLALPLYVLLVERVTARLSLRGWTIAQATLLAALSAASVAIEFGPAYPAPPWVGWSVTGTVLWFALGMALAVVSVLADTRPSAAALARATGAACSPLWALALVLYLVLALTLPTSAFVTSRGDALLVHVGFGVIALLLLAPVALGGSKAARDGAVARALAGRVLARLGLISYGVFLWHFAVVVALGPAHGLLGGLALLAGTLVVSAALATVSYLAIERPLMRLKDRPLAVRSLRSATAAQPRGTTRRAGVR